MQDKTEVRLREICRRTRTLRRRRENARTAGLSAVCVMLFACTASLVHSVQPLGVSSVAGGTGAVLLHGGAEMYVLVGIFAFVLGAVLTILCIRWKVKQEGRPKKADEEEDTE